MSSKLFTMVDRGVSHISPLSTFVDNVLHWFSPKMTALAATCSGLRWAINCYKAEVIVSENCSNNLGFTFDLCTLWYYNNGTRYNSCRYWGQHCTTKPPYQKCANTCTL